MTQTTLPTRLKEERKKLALTQQEIAEKVSVTRETWSRYESGKIHPGSEVIVQLVKLGVDTNYIITGKRTLSHHNKGHDKLAIAESTAKYNATLELTKQELNLIRNYRKASKEGKKSLEDTAKILAKQPK